MSRAAVQESRCPRWQQPQPPGKAARAGGPPEDIHLPLLRHPAHNCLASAGVVFSDSAFCVCSSLPGAVLTRPRLADARRQPLHDSAGDRVRPGGAHCNFQAAANAASAPLPRLPSAAARKVSIAQKLDLWVSLVTKENTEYSSQLPLASGGGGERPGSSKGASGPLSGPALLDGQQSSRCQVCERDE